MRARHAAMPAHVSPLQCAATPSHVVIRVVRVHHIDVVTIIVTIIVAIAIAIAVAIAVAVWSVARGYAATCLVPVVLCALIRTDTRVRASCIALKRRLSATAVGNAEGRTPAGGAPHAPVEFASPPAAVGDAEGVPATCHTLATAFPRAPPAPTMGSAEPCAAGPGRLLASVKVAAPPTAVCGTEGGPSCARGLRATGVRASPSASMLGAELETS
jgi:hypothetical protein